MMLIIIIIIIFIKDIIIFIIMNIDDYENDCDLQDSSQRGRGGVSASKQIAQGKSKHQLDQCKNHLVVILIMLMMNDVILVMNCFKS